MWMLAALAGVVSLAAAAPTVPPPTLAARAPAAFAGVWLFDGGPDYPGLRMIEFRSTGDRVSGVLTTDWYGPMPMEQLTVSEGVARFRIGNGNPSLPPREWTARLDSGALRVTGDIWYQQVDLRARRGSRAEARARRFALAAPLPPIRALAPDGLAQTPPMGWSSWNKFGAEIDDAAIRRTADVMVRLGLRDAGYRYVNIDDGWQGTRGSGGTIRPNARFPDMKGLADYVHARGLKLGIYSSPGPKTCAGFAGSYGHVEQDARTFAAWGVDYLKYDLCSGEYFYRDRDSIRRVYQQMGAALRATGRPMLYSLCEYGREKVGTWGRAVGGHLWRTTGDIVDRYDVMAGIGFDKNGDPADAGPGGWNDADMLEVGNGGMTLDAYRSHMTLWAMLASPLMMGHDVSATKPEILAILKHPGVLAIDQDPLGRQARRVRRAGDAEIWSKPLAGGSVALALFNRGTAPIDIVYSLADAGLPAASGVTDVWTTRPVDPARNRVTVPGQGTVLLKVRGPETS